MPTFIFKARDNQGGIVSDEIIASSQEEALHNLRKNYTLVTSLKEQKAKSFQAKGSGKVDLDQLAQFSRELSTMVGTGTPLVRSLIILSRQFKEKTLAGIAKDLSISIESGSSFSEGLSKYPAVFSPLYINLIAAGETSGMLNKILERLAIYLEKTAMLVRKIKTAMIYPAVILVVTFIITSFLMLKVIPSFKNIFDSLGGQLPLPTQIVVKISEIMRHYFLYLIFFFILSGVILYRYMLTSSGKLNIDKLKLSLPLVGSLFQKVAIARFSRTLATLLRGGIPILEALNIVAKSVGNQVLEKAIQRSKEEVRRGQRLALELEKEKFFPPMVVEMISVGEESGELDNMLDKIAESYEEQVDVATAGLVSLIEPFIIIFLGTVVGGIVVSMFLPILKITQLINK
jgi:type IV pilus assembly protein PilC